MNEVRRAATITLGALLVSTACGQEASQTSSWQVVEVSSSVSDVSLMDASPSQAPVDASLDADLSEGLHAEVADAELHPSETSLPSLDGLVDVQQAPQDAGPSLGELCFAELADAASGPDYEPYDYVIGSHCKGTNHQEIVGVGRVVFLGDSVTQGTPNESHLLSIDNQHFWRNLFAEWLTGHFGLDQGDLFSWGTWKTYDYLSGKGGAIHVGDFSNCAKWGARNDDLMTQIGECFPTGGSTETNLVVFTMGGNDISKITQLGGEASDAEVAAGYPAAWALAEEAIAYLEEAVLTLKSPELYPAGTHVVFGNPFEFTDGTGKVDACTPQGELEIPGLGAFDLSQFDLDMAALGGYAQWADPDMQAQIVIWILEQYMRIAVDHGADLVFMTESFCGHGFVATGTDADPEARCYLGPGAELWFDVTCIHPNDAGHAAIFDLFQAVVEE